MRYVNIIQIGNSKGIRIPKEYLSNCKPGDKVLIEQTEEGLLIKPVVSVHPRSEWGRLFDEAIQKGNQPKNEDWSDWDVTLEDGLENEAGNEK